MSLCALRDEMRQFDKERLPIMSEDRRPLHMIHRSMLERHMLDRHLAGGPSRSTDPRQISERNRGELPRWDVRHGRSVGLTGGRAGGYDRLGTDVFVTEDGASGSPVVGW